MRTCNEPEITIEFLRLVNESTGGRELIRAAATFFQQTSGCDAVGVRLKEGEDYLYFEARGFPPKFVVAENALCARDAAGEIIRDSSGNPFLEGMCGNVICGRFDPAKPFFTAHGSFWTNSTTKLLASTSEADRQGRTRNRCNREGYESVAVIPLRVGNQRFGLLQLDDRRAGVFSPEIISLWERLADQLAVALAKCQAEEALRESEARFRSLFENILEGFAYCRMLFEQDRPRDFIYLQVNNAFERLTGLKNVAGRRVTEVIPGIQDTNPELFEIYGRVALTGESEKFETYVEALGIWFSISVYSPARGHFVAVFDNTTERKQAEEKLRESEEQFRAIANYTADWENWFGPDGKLLWVNPAVERMTGYSVAECLAMPAFPRPLFAEEDRAAITAQFQEAVGGSRGNDWEFLFLHKDGTKRRGSVSWQPIFASDGTALGHRSSIRDIDERKRAEEALSRNQTELKAIYENAPTMMCVLDASRRVLYANRAFAEFVGRPLEELRLERACGVIGCLRALDDPRGCGHGPHCETCAVRLAMVDALATGRSHRAIEYRTTALCHGQPRDSVFLASVAPIQLTGQSNLLLCLEDITEREQAQEALRQVSGRFLQLQDEEHRRVARELHDTVAQGLAALSLNLGLLWSRAAALNPRSKKLLADSQALADQCAKEVRTSSYLLHPPILDELGLAGAIRDHADGFAHRSGLRVDLELPPDLVRLPRETELALFRVLQEALANIQRHSGSKTASIRVAQTADEIRLEVRDKGRGMVPKSVPAPERGLPARFGRPMFTGAREGLSDAQSGLEARAPGAVSGCAPLGMGILGMRERMRQLGGRLEIQSDCHGTSVIATVPRNQETRRA